MSTYRRSLDFTDNAVSKNLSSRIVYTGITLLALIALAALAAIVVYWSLNNGTLTKFSF